MDNIVVSWKWAAIKVWTGAYERHKYAPVQTLIAAHFIAAPKQSIYFTVVVLKSLKSGY